MHGVPRDKTQSPTEQAENEKKGKMGLMALDQCLKTARDLDRANGPEDFIDLSSLLLHRFPDVPALWHTRRRMITEIVTNKPSQPLVALLQTEVLLTKDALRKSIKCSPAWSQRQFVICLLSLVVSEEDVEEIGWTFDEEMKDLDTLLDIDDRNFHCWAHYRFLTDLRKIILEGLEPNDNLHSIILQITSEKSVFFPFMKSLPHELKDASSPFLESRLFFASARLKKSVSNGSAWHLRNLERSGVHTDEEDEFITDAIYTVAEDQGVWNYFEEYQLAEGHYPAGLLHAYVSSKSRQLFMRFDRPVILFDDEEQMKGHSPKLSDFKTLWERKVDLDDVLSSRDLKLYMTTVRKSTSISVKFKKLYNLGEFTTHLRPQIGETFFSIEGPMMSFQRYLNLGAELRTLVDCLQGDERRFVIGASCLLDRRMAWLTLGGTSTTNWESLIASYDSLVEIDSNRKGFYIEQQEKTKNIRQLLTFISNPDIRNLERMRQEVVSGLGEAFGDLLFIDG